MFSTVQARELTLDDAMVRVQDGLDALGAAGADRAALEAHLAPELAAWLARDEDLAPAPVCRAVRPVRRHLPERVVESLEALANPRRLPRSLAPARLVDRAEDAFLAGLLSVADLAKLLEVLAHEEVTATPPLGPTAALPGSEEKILDLMRRADWREPLFQKGDGLLPDRLAYNAVLDGCKYERHELVELVAGGPEGGVRLAGQIPRERVPLRKKVRDPNRSDRRKKMSEPVATPESVAVTPAAPDLSAAAWADRLARQKVSGLSIRDFCAREGVKEQHFYDRRKRLAPAPAKKPTPKPRPVLAAPVLGMASPIAAPVAVAASPVAPPTQAEIVLPGGAMLRVQVGADPLWVAGIIRALAAAA